MGTNKSGGIIPLIVLLSLFGRGNKVDKRLAEIAGEQSEEGPIVGISPTSRELVNERIEKALEGKGFASTISRKLVQADLKLTIAEFLGIKVFSAGVGFGLGFFIGRTFGIFAVVIGILMGIVALYVPDIYINFRGKGRIKKFNGQLADTITLLANGLRSGNSFLQAMEMVAREGQAPMSDEFGRVIREVGLGVTTREALANMLRRVPSNDLDLLITAINIQSEVGGNLAQVLDSIGHTIRERVRIQGEIKVLTAQQQYAGYIISGLPIALGLVLFGIAPTYMIKMFAWPFVCMPICAGVLILIGFLAIKKIVAIDI